MDVIALPLQGGCSLLYVTQGDGALRLCPGLICYGLSARLNARLRRASYLFFRPPQMYNVPDDDAGVIAK